MRLLRLAIPFLCLAPLSLADLTKEQKTSDFMQVVGLYNKQYAPYELRRDVFGFDLLNVKPWLDQANQTKSDVEFYDVMVRYVASLQDSHDAFTLPSSYEAWMHMDGDLYDGKMLIDFIDRTWLARKDFPFTIGDEIISVDGKSVADLITAFAPYSVNGEGNDLSRKRLAVATITDRYQGWYPLAHQISTNAAVVIKRTDGSTATYDIPWDIRGTPITSAGVVPNPFTGAAAKFREAISGLRSRQRIQAGYKRGAETGEDGSVPNPWGVATVDPDPIVPDSPQPQYMQPLLDLQHAEGLVMPRESGFASGLSPFDIPVPLFDPPDNFVLRLGARSSDQFLSGTYASGKNTIGFIRIPSMSPSSTATALSQFATEVAFFQKSADGLVIDVMGNGGGSVCYTELLVSYLMPTTFRRTGEQIRATLNWQRSFASARESAKRQKAAQWVVDLYDAYLKEIQQALTENRGLTGPLPLCSATFDQLPATSPAGVNLAYTKPILVVTDNYTLSAGELFTMFLQDNKRATVLGMRTDGGGGNVVGYSNAASYSEGSARVTQGLITRLNPVATPGYPASVYTDRFGVYPDMVEDYMTVDNLNNGGATFVNAITKAITGLIGQ